jgi:predicted dehydrogenase
MTALCDIREERAEFDEYYRCPSIEVAENVLANPNIDLVGVGNRGQ